MNYYERHLGDYAKDTAHLSMMEHGAYNLLLDRYYATEVGIPEGQAHRVARARSKEEKQAVDVVLDEFFELVDGVWINNRTESEIAKFRRKSDAARENGKKGGRPKKVSEIESGGTKEKPNGFLTGSDSESGPKAHQTPDTSNHNSVPNGTGGEPPFDSGDGEAEKPKPMEPVEIIFGYGVPLLVNAGAADKQARSFLGGLRKQHGDPAVVDALRECLKAKPLQPLEWLAAALPPKGAAKGGFGKPPRPIHRTSFDDIDYSKGINPDGSF